MAAAIGGGTAIALHGKDSDPTATGPTYQSPTDECALISPAVLTTYTPGAACKRTPTVPMAHGEFTRSPSWTVDAPTHPASIQVDLRITSAAAKSYANAKSSFLDRYGPQLTKPKSADINPSDLGPQVQEAFVISGASVGFPGRADSRLIMRAGNAVVEVAFNDWTSPDASEAAVKAIAADLITNLR
ncbi:hypothetical protein [Nocardia sp. NPDC046763]|uniref:hypothetical protein n=1 Tax=Nocardia sp. NPDC046763 TaxID=3155256 RepID=UPI0033EBECCE